jgi:hypothetical protein
VGTGGGGFDRPRTLPGRGGGNDDNGGGVGILPPSKGGGMLKTFLGTAVAILRLGTYGDIVDLSSCSRGILGGRAGEDEISAGGTGRRWGGDGATEDDSGWCCDDVGDCATDTFRTGGGGGLPLFDVDAIAPGNFGSWLGRIGGMVFFGDLAVSRSISAAASSPNSVSTNWRTKSRLFLMTSGVIPIWPSSTTSCFQDLAFGSDAGVRCCGI